MSTNFTATTLVAATASLEVLANASMLRFSTSGSALSSTLSTLPFSLAMIAYGIGEGQNK
jgi:hypothetical protein